MTETLQSVGKMRMYRAADGVRSVAQKTGERRPPKDEQKSKQGKATKNYEVEGDRTRNSAWAKDLQREKLPQYWKTEVTLLLPHCE